MRQRRRPGMSKKCLSLIRQAQLIAIYRLELWIFMHQNTDMAPALIHASASDRLWVALISAAFSSNCRFS